MNFVSLMTRVLEAAPAGADEMMAPSLLSMLLPFVVLILVMYFMMIRPQRKRDKKMEEMRSNLEVGDEVTTSGGIIGRVVSIQEDTIVIETGTARSKLRIARWAIQANNTIKDDVPEAQAQQKKCKSPFAKIAKGLFLCYTARDYNAKG